MRAVLVALIALVLGLVAGSLRPVTVQTRPDGAIGTAPDLASPHVETEAGARPTEYCGPTRLAVVRRVAQLGETHALADILPPSRWEAWPDVERACEAKYGPPPSRAPL